MRIKFNQKYKSIEKFNDVDIENFSVFLGVNGSGKTHLLKAIQEGFVLANSIPKERISYFNLQTFLIKNQKKIAPRNLDDEKLQAWNILDAIRDTLRIYDDQIKKIVGDKEYPYTQKVSGSQETLYNQQKKNILGTIDYRTGKNAKIKKLLTSGIFESDKYASEMKQEDFFKFSNYDPGDYELLESLSEVFLDYKKKLSIASLPKRMGGEEVRDEELRQLENRAPWNFVNDMFGEFGLNHKITYPTFKEADLIRSQAIEFQVKLYLDGVEIDFEDLSSGEKILCALAITVYQDNKSQFPELLLLDEVDASLHPSMIQNLLDVVRNTFVRNECNVILATHSPTTVALASDASLFEVQKGKVQEKIRKISQKDAINILSEGIITLEKGLKIYSEVDGNKKLQIITEGKNTEHIEKAILVLDGTLIEKIKIITGAKNASGSSQLKQAFETMSKADHDNSFLFVWDCDFAPKMKNINETEKFRKFCFAENSANTKARDKNGVAIGIENLYSNKLFTEEVYSDKERAGPYDTITYVKEFDKQKFLEKIKRESDPEVFQNFSPIIKMIREIIGNGRED